MSIPKNLLFIGHKAERSGAPLILLEFIKWLSSNSDFKPSVLLKDGGELLSDYQSIAKTYCYGDVCRQKNWSVLRRGLRKLKLARLWQPNLAALYPVSEYPIIFANTIDTCDLTLQLAGAGRRIVHRIPELPYITGHYGAESALKQGVAHTDAYVAVSQSVRSFLKEKIGVPDQKIHVIHGFPLVVHSAGIQKETRQAVRSQLGIPVNSCVVGACGIPQWRKGSDLFVQLAKYVNQGLNASHCHFIWLGGNTNGHREMLHDATQLGLQNNCHFVPAVSNPEAYFSAFDIFALTSREEPFSVAMLEAAASGLPVVCFADAGGGPELVENDAGVVVPYLDVPAMAKACIDLLSDENRRRQFGNNASIKVHSRYLLAKQGPKLLNVLESVLNVKR
jgi:glycosyltransferase involved in cell wall biosynthesis